MPPPDRPAGEIIREASGAPQKPRFDRPTWGIWAPPKEIILMTKAVFGNVDLDPYSLPVNNRAMMARRIYDRSQLSIDDICAMDWEAPGEKKAFVSIAGPAVPSKRLLNKTLLEYQRGNISQALLWIANNESLTRCPWLWDHPVCIPFRRLKPLYWDSIREEFLSFAPADWSAVVYLPPHGTAVEYHTMLSRFHVSFSAFGRVIFNQFSGEGDWEAAYRAYMRKDYNYRGA